MKKIYKIRELFAAFRFLRNFALQNSNTNTWFISLSVHVTKFFSFKLGWANKKKQPNHHKDKAVPVHAIKTYRGSGGTAPFIPNLGTGWSWVVKVAPQQLYSWGNNARTHLSRSWVGPRNSLDVSKKKNLLPLLKVESPARNLTTAQSTLSRLQYTRNNHISCRPLKAIFHPSKTSLGNRINPEIPLFETNNFVDSG